MTTGAPAEETAGTCADEAAEMEEMVDASLLGEGPWLGEGGRCSFSGGGGCPLGGTTHHQVAHWAGKTHHH